MMTTSRNTLVGGRQYFKCRFNCKPILVDSKIKSREGKERILCKLNLEKPYDNVNENLWTLQWKTWVRVEMDTMDHLYKDYCLIPRLGWRTHRFL